MERLLAKLKTTKTTLYTVSLIIAYLMHDHVSMSLSFLFIHLCVGVYWINQGAKNTVDEKYNPDEEDNAVGRKVALEDKTLLRNEMREAKQMLFVASILMMIFAWSNFTARVDIRAFETYLNKTCMPATGREAKRQCERLKDKFEAKFGYPDNYDY